MKTVVLKSYWSFEIKVKAEFLKICSNISLYEESVLVSHFKIHNYLHNEYGPAIIAPPRGHYTGTLSVLDYFGLKHVYYLNGNPYTEEEWLREKEFTKNINSIIND